MDSNGKTEPVVFTAQEVADLLSISLKGVYEQAAQGQIPGRIKIGTRTVRFRRAVISAWLEAGCPDATEWEIPKGL